MYLVLHKLRWNMKEHGLAGLLEKFLDTVSKEIFHGSEHLFYVDLSGFRENAARKPENINIISYMKKEDIPGEVLDSLKEFVLKKGMHDDFARYYLDQSLYLFQEGAMMHVAMVKNEPAAYLWSMTNTGNHSPYFSFFPLLPEDVLVFGGTVLPSRRGQGLMPMLIRHGASLAKGAGKKRVYATCKTWNTASRRCIEKAGLKEFCVARGISLFGRRIAVWPKAGRPGSAGSHGND